MNSFHYNEYLKSYTPMDYGQRIPSGEIILDCSLGVNSNLLDVGIFEQLNSYHREHNYSDIKQYPHDDSLKDLIVRWFNTFGVGKDFLNRDCIVFGNGSYEILCNLNMFCLTGGKMVMGHAPQFSAYVDNVFCTGSGYAAYYLPAEHNYKFLAEEYISMMTDSYDMFIIENPNNPTGQIISLEDIEKIAKKAESLGRILVVDEAYGEYIPFDTTAINLIDRFHNLIVTRSFSKGWGMAGIRLGYAVASQESKLLSDFSKLELGFNSNAIAKRLASAAIESVIERYMDPVSLRANARIKTMIINALKNKSPEKNKIKIMETSPTTPIMVLYYQEGGEDFDLQEYLMKYGLLTVSCSAYMGLGANAVRLMLPEEDKVEKLIDILCSAIANLN